MKLLFLLLLLSSCATTNDCYEQNQKLLYENDKLFHQVLELREWINDIDTIK